jgi:ribosomal protein S6--L-glutamate ligase
VRICVLADWLNPIMRQTFDLLAERGVTVDVRYPDKELIDLASVKVEHDLYVLKSGTDVALSLAGLLHSLGARTVNPYQSVSMLRNKIVVTGGLGAAGVPVPETFVTNDPNDLDALLAEGPLIIKPYRGSRGEGIRVVHELGELLETPSERPILAQRYMVPDGRDRKLYCAGERVFGVLREWPLRTYADKLGEPFEPDDDLCDIAVRCGKAFGVGLFGIDVVMCEGKPYVVDMNKFGSWMGVAQAPSHVADYLVATARGG